MAPIDVGAITAEIGKTEATWVAAETSLVHLSDEEQRARLGVNVDKQQLQAAMARAEPDVAPVIAHFEALMTGDNGPRQGPGAMVAAPAKLLSREELPAATVEAVRARLAVPLPVFLGQVVDWRDRKGRDNVTPIRDQGGCGSCVSFGSTATLESMTLVEHNVAEDLSEAELLFCGGGGCGGWWPDPAVTYIRNNGVAQEICFPYFDRTMPCHTCAERRGEAVAAAQEVVISDVAGRKHYLANVGPMIGVFAVYQDFFAYRSGVYHHVTGGLAGYHCIEVIGYDDFLHAWICKNSWGVDWGDYGFFKIRFGECEIDSTFPFWGIYGTHWL